MKKYYINYNTGAGNFEFEGTLDDAKKKAEEGICYTQQDVYIKNEEGNIVACLPWWGVEPEEDDYVTEQFGSFGFYGEWEER
jgi:hypothetical protein